ncbi:MAG: flavodoxin domain-containing protein [Chloroflexi bacterium]|nr:flavodoxin domain-containing protein [Chloroflexota bacterium]
MKKVIVVYYGVTGSTEKMAQYIAEGVRFTGNQVVVKNIKDIKTTELRGYDGYIFGSPTFSLDIPGPMKVFLAGVEEAALKGKPGGAFGPYRHDMSYEHSTHAPALIFEMLETRYKMKPFELGPFSLKEDVVDTSQGMETCQDYGRVFGEKLGNE